MKETLDSLQTSTLSAIDACKKQLELDNIKQSILGKNGELTQYLKKIKLLPKNERPIMGQHINDIKKHLLSAIESKKHAITHHEWDLSLKKNVQDSSLPEKGMPTGNAHPLTQTIHKATECFKRLGFSIESGPDIESNYYNFEALNIPQHHPARDMHDTFYLNSGKLLRTHTSPAQIHAMQAHQPPLKIIMPGMVYRRDADISHSPVFHQIEGLYVNQNVSMAELKGTLEFFLHDLFGSSLSIRFRPSYFPFTEPSVEVDLECPFCKEGCRVCKFTCFIEIMGAGMVHHHVFNAVGYPPDQIMGFAFGLGIDRLTMLLFDIPDIRLLYENDIRFLTQF